MKIYQEVLNALTAETQGILEQAGYNGNSLVLNASLKPGVGWQYEALAAKRGQAVRQQLVRQGEAKDPEQLLDLLRQRVALPLLKQAA